MTTDSEPRRTIVWRPALRSFLEPLDLHALRSLLRREIGRHFRGLRKGTILEPQEFWDRFMVQARNDQGQTCWEPSPESTGSLRTYESFALIDDRLRERCGSWFPRILSNSVLGPIVHPRSASKSATPPSRNHVVETMIEHLTELHRWTDRYLHGLYERFGLHGIESIEDEFSAVQRWIAQDLGVADDHEDRWFGAMGHRTHLFLESVGCRVTVEEIDAIADTHFNSWVAPQPDDLTRYADELAALSVERLFAERYGDHGEAKPECDAP